MKYFICIFVSSLIITLSNVYSQTSEEITRESNTDYILVQDNSPFAVAQRELAALRKSGNEQGYLSKLNQEKLKFPDKYVQSSPVSNNVLRVISPDPNRQGIPANETDWNPGGDNIITTENISSPTSGNPTANNRLVRMTSDSNGILFVAYTEASRDTLNFYRSTDQGRHWDEIFAIESNPDEYYQGFDIAATDGATETKVGMVVSMAPYGSSYNASVYFATINSDGTEFTPSFVEGSIDGRGRISPCLVTDGWNMSPLTTNWYVAYQSADTNTGETDAAIAAYTPDFGASWLYDTARSSFNDYELDINYNFGGDSIYVLLTNDLTTTNPNLRLRWIALSNWGTSVSWKQFNPATSASPEFDGQFSVNRGNQNAVVTYTITTGGLNNVKYAYSLDGSTPWVSGNPIVSQANNVERASVYSLPQQNGSFRIAFISQGTSYDTVLYYNTLSIQTGFGNRQVVNQNNASNSLKPVIAAGFYPAPFSNVCFAGSGNTGLYVDGTDIITELSQTGSIIPDGYKLEQNYPNPFNPTTTISFSIPKNQIVSLKIYDALGKETASLVNEELATGQYDLKLNGSNLGSGIYFYTLTAGDYKKTRKMILLK